MLEIDSVEFHGLPPDADATDTRHIQLEALGYSVIHRRPAFIVREPRGFVAGVAIWLAGCRARST